MGKDEKEECSNPRCKDGLITPIGDHFRQGLIKCPDCNKDKEEKESD